VSRRIFGSIAEKTFESSHSSQSRLRLAGEGAYSREHGGINGTGIIQERTYHDLELLTLGGSGWRGKVRGSSRLGSFTTIGGGSIYSRGGGKTNAVRSNTG